MTPCAAGGTARLGAGLGSFDAARKAMSALHCGRLSESKARNATLGAGEAARRAQEAPDGDVRAYTEAQRRASGGSRWSRARSWRWRTGPTRPA